MIIESLLERTLILFIRLPMRGNLFEIAFILFAMPVSPPRWAYKFSFVAIAILIASFVAPSALKKIMWISSTYSFFKCERFHTSCIISSINNYTNFERHETYKSSTYPVIFSFSFKKKSCFLLFNPFLNELKGITVKKRSNNLTLFDWVRTSWYLVIMIVFPSRLALHSLHAQGIVHILRGKWLLHQKSVSLNSDYGGNHGHIFSQCSPRLWTISSIEKLCPTMNKSGLPGGLGREANYFHPHL